MGIIPPPGINSPSPGISQRAWERIRRPPEIVYRIGTTMLIRKGGDLQYSEITPKSVYFNRRQFLAAAPAAFLAGRAARAAALGNVSKSPLSTTEPVTDPKYVKTYNNFYEFGTAK